MYFNIITSFIKSNINIENVIEVKKVPKICEFYNIYYVSENYPFFYPNDDLTINYQMTIQNLSCVKHAQHMLASKHVFLTQSNKIIL